MDQEQIRRLSKALLGNAYRLEIADAVSRAQTELVTAQGLSTDLQIPHNLVSKQLKDFVLAGVMSDVPPVEGMRYRYFRRLSDPYWSSAQVLLAEWRGRSIAGISSSGLRGP